MEGFSLPDGEAIPFKWFEIANIPRGTELGFGQGAVLKTCVPFGKSVIPHGLEKDATYSSPHGDGLGMEIYRSLKRFGGGSR
jgi:hypothetical protein